MEPGITAWGFTDRFAGVMALAEPAGDDVAVAFVADLVADAAFGDDGVDSAGVDSEGVEPEAVELDGVELDGVTVDGPDVGVAADGGGAVVVDVELLGLVDDCDADGALLVGVPAEVLTEAVGVALDVAELSLDGKAGGATLAEVVPAVEAVGAVPAGPAAAASPLLNTTNVAVASATAARTVPGDVSRHRHSAGRPP